MLRSAWMVMAAALAAAAGAQCGRCTRCQLALMKMRWQLLATLRH